MGGHHVEEKEAKAKEKKSAKMFITFMNMQKKKRMNLKEEKLAVKQACESKVLYVKTGDLEPNVAKFAQE